ncbi:probable glutamate--tRNA ligase, mitochondrial [Tribolium madens]|uniref:probable glutamate--tRNA ligase, mitochondrial n=1 Tax=Tribolium madens TaxID=41895 RepID=UPI001CF7484C|nr:probable glutamate--tRNA ligase, mitochondrial [Tribolium madens]
MQSFIQKTPIARFCTKETVRVRFAPSPTGFLHLGGLRTALYNYFFAKSRNGAFILRIEDTDQSRLVEGAIEQLQRDLDWAGVQIDEGPSTGGCYGPYIQSQRLHIYRGHVETLLNNGSAYHCFCTEKRLELLRREAIRVREVPKYDNRCRSLNPQEVGEKLAQGIPSCVRFKLVAGVQSYLDLIYGGFNYDVAANEGDPVIVKSDGFPTYHFANVIDDHLMKISHVLRGVEWQISTPKHIMMYRAFNWEPPLFGHLPLLMNPDGSKLSKRQGDIRIGHYRDQGIFPLALINFIASSGGGFGKDSEQNVKPKCYTIGELTRQFDVCRINAHSGKLMPERLFDFNRLELKRKLEDSEEGEKLVEEVREMVKKHFPGDSLQLGSEHVRNILHWSVNRVTKLPDLLSDDLKFIWVSPKSYKIAENDLVPIRIFVEKLDKQVLERDNLNAFFKSFCKEHQLKFGSFMKTLRSLLSGLKEGPSVAEMMEILGKENTIERLHACIKNNK